MCFLVYVDSTDLVSQTLPAVCLSRPARRRRASTGASTGASTFLDRISLVADRTRVRTVQRQYCVIPYSCGSAKWPRGAVAGALNRSSVLRVYVSSACVVLS